jgi:hypothetical protein
MTAFKRTVFRDAFFKYYGTTDYKHHLLKDSYDKRYLSVSDVHKIRNSQDLAFQ